MEMRVLKAFWGLFFGMALGGSAFAEKVTKVEVGVNTQMPTEQERIDAPYQTNAMRFEIDPKPGLLRYRLANFDPNWIERSEVMYFLVLFLNEKGDQIRKDSFPVHGKSSGWKGREDISIPSKRHEMLTVPAQAKQMVVSISSAGPASGVGAYAVSRLKVSTRRSDMGESRVLISEEKPVEWANGGTQPSMTKTRKGVDGEIYHIIMDESSTGHVDWRTIPNPSTKVNPGETIYLEWQETYCTGIGSSFAVQYGRIPPGEYIFEVQSFGYSGMEPGELLSIPIHVSAPYWRNPWYWAGFVVVAAGLGTLIGNHFIQKKIQLHLREERMIADERLRIARDLHDDLGARLSHISLLGAHALSSANDPQDRKSFEDITKMTRDLVTSLSESVWMLNSKNDRLDSLIDYLCRMVGDLCRPLEIRCRIDADSPDENLPVSGEFRHHVTMSVKEAVNNALKHSGCSEIRLKAYHRIRQHRSYLEIFIEDNGSGLKDTNSMGNGLDNIRQRVDQLQGQVTMGATEGGGTAIHVIVPLKLQEISRR